MEVKDAGEIIYRVWIQTQGYFAYVEAFPLWFGDASTSLHWQFGSGWWECLPVFLHWLHGWKFVAFSRELFRDQQHSFVFQQDNAHLKQSHGDVGMVREKW